ncbi:MAG: CHAT domain-containing protein [Planctomycetes bacterium]|nr:CHAT domain-containing protein [Planctomycetota bacterium]
MNKLERHVQTGRPADQLATELLAEIDRLPEHALPFEWLRSLLTELSPTRALHLLRCGLSLPVWNAHESAVLEYRRLKLEQDHADARSRREGRITAVLNYRSHLRPGSISRASASFRAATWIGAAADHSLITDMLTIDAPERTPPGFYVRCAIFLLDKFRIGLNLAQRAVESLSNAWTLLGLARLDDRAAVVAILVVSRTGDEARLARLRGELSYLLPRLDSKRLRGFVGRLAQLQPIDTVVPADPLLRDSALRQQLRLGRAADVAKRAMEHLNSARGCPEDVLLGAVALSRSSTSGRALEFLAAREQYMASAGPECRWAFHYLRAALHWKRLENHLALAAIEEARSFVALTSVDKYLFRTHSLRRRIGTALRIPWLTKTSDSVMKLIAERDRAEGRNVGVERAVAISGVVGASIAGFKEAVTVIAEQEIHWQAGVGKDGHRNIAPSKENLRILGRQLTLIANACNLNLTSAQEPEVVARILANRLQFALRARWAWRDNRRLFTSAKAWAKTVFELGQQVEAYRFLDWVYSEIIGTGTRAVLPEDWRGEFQKAPRPSLESLERFATGATTAWQARKTSDAIRDGIIEILEGSVAGKSDAFSILRLLQIAKGPAVPVDWAAIAARLSRESAAHIELFITNARYVCIVATSQDGVRLECQAYIESCTDKVGFAHEAGRVRDLFFRTFSTLSAIADRWHLHEIASVALPQRLHHAASIFPGPFADRLREIAAKTLYIAPSMATNDLPCHMHGDTTAWRPGGATPVLHVVRAADLAAREREGRREASFVVSREPPFHALGLHFAHVGRVIRPCSKTDILGAFRAGAIVVLVGHAAHVPGKHRRSHVRFGRGLSLALRDLKEVRDKDFEVVIVGCWGGWSVRGDGPAEHRHGGPRVWINAGAAAVLAPLWPIPAAAGVRFALDYVSARVQGARRSSALLRAREACRSYEFGEICRASFVFWGPDGA